MVVILFGIVRDVTSSLLRYKFLIDEPAYVKPSIPAIPHHAAKSVIYIFLITVFIKAL